MCAETPDYKTTLNLPKTDFPMRAGLPKREPDWLARWETIGVYDRLREKQGRRNTHCMMALPMQTDICTSVTH